MKRYFMTLFFAVLVGLMTTAIQAGGVVFSVQGGMTTAIQAGIILNVQDFGAVGDGVTDDSTAIQQALVFAFTNKKDLYFPSATYAIGTTLIIPQYMDYTTRGISIDCGNSTFKMLNDTTLFTSGYDNSGVLTSNFGTSDDFRFSLGIVLKNFTITSDIGTLTATALKIQDWHQGSAIQNIASKVTEVILQSHNNYYTLFDNIRTTCISSTARFDFTGYHNLCKFTRLMATGAAIGYKFAALTACQFSYNSVEDVGIGLQFTSSVYDIVIENNCCKNFSDVVIQFNAYVYAATIKNNYVDFTNHGTSHFLDYEPLPRNNIIIDSDNIFLSMPSQSNMIKTIDNVYSKGVVIRRAKINASSLDDLIVSNTVYSINIDWQQKVDMPGMRANVVNKYAVGNYSGKYTDGRNTAHGFEWVDTSSSTLQLNTKIINSDTQRIYVNIYVSGTTGLITGEFIGSTFYRYDATGVSVSTILSISVVNGYVQIDGAYSGTVTECKGEIRLM